MLREQTFRRYLVGHSASLLGSAMATVGVAFAVIASGGGATELGLVSAARILPIVLFVPLGGALADRLGSRRVVLFTDALQCATQVTFAVLLLLGDGAAPLSAVLALVALWGAAEAAAMPAVGALPPRLVSAARLPEANALLGTVRAAASVAGPSLAGLLVAVQGSAAVLLLDGASYAVSVLTLALIRTAPVGAAGGQSLLRQLREGWTEFRSRRWLWVTTLHMALFNFVVWAPFLVLGPVLADARYDGAAAWGAVMGAYGLGAVTAGVLLLGRRPRYPLRVGTLASVCWALPSLGLALRLPTVGVCAAALAAGAGGAVCGALYQTVIQQRVPQEALGRVSAYGTLGAFALGPLGLAVAGPVAGVVGPDAVLLAGALWQCAAVATVLAVPAVREVRQQLPAAGPEQS